MDLCVKCKHCPKVSPLMDLCIKCDHCRLIKRVYWCRKSFGELSYVTGKLENKTCKDTRTGDKCLDFEETK